MYSMFLWNVWNGIKCGFSLTDSVMYFIRPVLDFPVLDCVSS